MDPARWEKVIELYHAASEREPARRSAFLSNACEGDDGLRSEVESLLRQDLSEGDMLERIAEDNRNAIPAAKLHSRPMTLSVGTRLAHYEILALLGAGGMGEVYRARDLKLKREVAIKILPEEFSRDADRVSRFQREAEVLASLNHPNIAIIHDVQEANETRFLVLELVDGETLAERIQHGPIPVEEALKIGEHIREALQAAHERGIIHRDLKPANVKITPDGKVKVLDFGLAKAIPEEPASYSFSDSPTINPATSAGMILGTAIYMSPEQVRGKPVDKRADIWAFGVLLYEMVTGRPPFQGTDTSEILASVIKDNPGYEVIPPAVRRLIKKCLEKDPARRLRDIGDAWELLEAPSSGSAQAEVVPAPARLRWAGWMAAALLALPAGWLYFHQPIPTFPSVAKLEWDLPFNGTAMELSPDDSLLSFGSPDRGIWIRPLNSNAGHVLPGTEKYSGSWFWSPDSRFIAFSQNNKLKKIDVTGGPPSTVLDALVGGASRGGSWNPDGVLLLGSATGIQRASLAGGAITNATTVDKSKELDHLSPVFLPDGKHFIYVRTNANRQNAAVYLGSIDEKPDQQSLKPLIASTQYGTNDGHVYYVSTGKDDPNIGYIVYKRDNTVFAQAFNAKTLIVSAESVPLSDANAWFFTATPNVLAHNTGDARGVPIGQLMWYDRATKETQPLGDPAVQFSLNLSPDGSRVAVERALSPSRFRAVWAIDSRPYRETKLTDYELTACCGVWSPDGSEIIFTARDEGLVPTGLYRMSSNGAGQPKLLLKGPHHSLSWSREGILMLTTFADSTDLWTLDLGKDDAKPDPYLNSPSSEIQGQFSPDGRWVAYTSNESGKNEVYVRSFPDPSRSKTPISSDGGSMPRWSRDGRELFYFAADDTLTSVAVTLGAQFKMHERKPVFTVRPARRALDRAGTALSWDVVPDGRFLINTSVNPDEAAPTSVVLNWQSLFKK